MQNGFAPFASPLPFFFLNLSHQEVKFAFVGGEFGYPEPSTEVSAEVMTASINQRGDGLFSRLWLVQRNPRSRQRGIRRLIDGARRGKLLCIWGYERMAAQVVSG